MLCPDINNKIIINEAEEGKGEQLRAGKPRHEDDMTEDRHSVGREEFRGMNGLEKKYNLVVVGAGLSGSVVAERASKLLGLKVLSCQQSGLLNITSISESRHRQEGSHRR